MGNLGVVCTWIPLLLSAPSGTSVQSERAGKVIATYQKTIQEKKLDVKELRKQAEHYNSILYQTNGATLSGEDALLLGDASYASLLDTTGDGGYGEVWISQRLMWNCRSIMERMIPHCQTESDTCRERAFLWAEQIPIVF